MADSNTSNSTLTTDFNVTPYYDDYKPDKQFYRMLFVPARAVQGRELTQMQSMMQAQIYRFGRHVFKEGAIVLPGQFNLRTNIGDTKGNPIDYVKLKPVDGANNVITIADFLGEKVVGQTSNIAASVIEVLDSDGSTANTKTLYVNYLSASSSNASIRRFIAGETLLSANAGTCIVLDTDPVANTGYSSYFEIEEGVFFAKDHFIWFPTQHVVLDRYNANPSCHVGFYVSEEIIKASQDTSLLDPALESSNYSAPGADRLRLVSELSVVNYEEDPGQDFISLFKIKNGIIQTTNEKTEYNILGDTLAGRTFDESGDYVVKGLNVQISEHDLITTPVNNYGRFANGNNSLLIVSVDPGYGYVHGYPVQNFDRYDIEINKPTDFRNVASQISATTMGQYLRVTEFVGSWQLDQSKRVNFYDLVQKRVTNAGVPTNIKWSTGAQTGNNIGSAIIQSVQYVEGTPGYNAQYDIYLTDVKMTGANNFSNVRSLYFDNTPHSDIGADVLGANNSVANTSLREVNQSPLLYYVGSDFVRSVRDEDGNPQTTYYYNKTDGISSGLALSVGGTLSVVLSGPSNEILPYGTTTLSDTDVNQDIILTCNETFNIGPLTGTITGNLTQYIVGSGTNFLRLNPGDKIEIAGQSGNTFHVLSVSDNTHMMVSNTIPVAVSGAAYFKAYKTGDIIPLSGKGVLNGVERTVAATPTTLSIDIKETLPQEVDVTVSYKLATTESTEAAKTLRPNRFAIISTAVAGTSGPFCLGFSDVLRIRNVVKKTGSAPSSLSDGTNVTSYFRLDNGQRDTKYELASIIKSAGLSLGGTDFLLVELDYFIPNFSSRAGFYSINSYPIEDDDSLSANTNIRTENIPVYTSPTTGLKYDLRNFIDFRPIKVITANDATAVASATLNPSSNSTSYNFAASGMKFPVPSTEITYDYSYYIGRKDIVVANKDGVFAVVKGVPSEHPMVPEALDTQMLLAILDIAPYPSLSPAYANALARKDLSVSAKKASNRRYTMRDIGIIDQRLKNIEYYTSLTLLEKDALNLKILDEDGLDRFKNGIFIDTFRDESLTAKGIDRDYRIVTDPVEMAIRPLFSTESIDYDYMSGTGVRNNNGVITMDYTEEAFFNQPKVTDVRNLERGTYYFQGTLSLFPNQDVWIDTSFAPDEIVSIDANDSLLEIDTNTPGQVDQVAAIKKSLINTTWEGWKTTVTGYNLYRDGIAGPRVLIGTFSTEAAARAAAAAWTTKQNGGTASIETVYSNSRVGTNYFANESTDTAVGSNKLISSAVIPYIRPQNIVIKAENLKPYSRMHVFFDGVMVDAYVTPLTEAQWTRAIAKQPNNNLAAEGSELIVNTNGTLYLSFRISADGPKFRTGERKFVIMDGEQLAPETIASEVDSSTIAVGAFYADGSKQTLQRTVYSTEGYSKTSEATSEQYTSKANLTIPNTWKPPAPKKSHCCFDPEAPVTMMDGTEKMIKDIVPGDWVKGQNGFNQVLANKTIGVGSRIMVKFNGFDFYTTDDHLFLTDKGWKTWNPATVLKDKDTVNALYLTGANRYTPIQSGDKLKWNDTWIDYDDLGAVYHTDFAEDYVVHDLTLDGDCTYYVDGFLVHNCCVAYGVLIRTPVEEEGLFTTGFDIFVGRKSQTRGLWFELREIDTGGTVTETQIPGSEVHLTNAEVLESTNGIANPTEVRFPAPVFLFNNQQYAFVIHSDSPNDADVDPDTQIWISRLGETDRNTGEKINDRQKTGTFFQTSNNKQWDIIPDIDLRIDIYRAVFTTGTASFIIGNKPVEKLFLSNLNASITGRIGDFFTSGDTLTLAGANGTISVGQTLRGNISTLNANGTVVTVVGGGQYALSNTKYRVGEKVDLYHTANGVYAGVSANVSAISNSTAQLAYVDETSANIYSEWITSTGGFIPNTVIQSLTSGGYTYRGTVTDIMDFRYSAMSFEPKVLDFVRTNIGYEVKAAANDSFTLSDWAGLYASDTYYFTEEKKVYGKTHELNDLAGARSNQVRVTFDSNSEYVSPVLNLGATHTIYIDNLINANTSGETAASGGQALNKYISQTITLADGQDAEDLKVFLTAYRPPNTDVLVYIKMLHQSDGDTLAQKSWVAMEKNGDGDSVYSSISNRFNYREFTYNIPDAIKTGPDGQVQYTANGITYTGYKYFAIKIVLTATNSAVVPRGADLRAIALQI
jgi:hypothetical protein